MLQTFLSGKKNVGNVFSTIVRGDQTRSGVSDHQTVVLMGQSHSLHADAWYTMSPPTCTIRGNEIDKVKNEIGNADRKSTIS